MYVIDCVDCSVFSVHVSCVYADLSESHNSRAIGDTTGMTGEKRTETRMGC